MKNPNKDVKKIPDNALVVAKNQYYSMDCRETGVNNNVLVVGTSGGGKTRGVGEPNIMQASGNYVVSDPKGRLYEKYKDYLEAKGYRVLKMNFIHPEQSLHYNPMGKIRNTQDIVKLAHMIVYNEHTKLGKSVDPFWDEATLVLFTVILGYLYETEDIPEEEKNFETLCKLVTEVGKDFDEHDRMLHMPKLFYRLEQHNEKMKSQGKESWAYHRFQVFKTCPEKTHNTIVMTSYAKLASFDTKEINIMMEKNDINFASIGTEKTALFVEVSDTDRSMDLLVNLFYSQLMNELCSYADEFCENGCLPIPVRFILDDFATNCRIDNFQNMIANIRSRGISAMLMVQSEAQLYACYGMDGDTIIDCCNTYIYLGTDNAKTAHSVAERANKAVHTIQNMPLGTCWIFRRGQEPIFCERVDYDQFAMEKGFLNRTHDMLGQEYVEGKVC